MEATLASPAVAAKWAPPTPPATPRLPRSVEQLLEWLDPKDFGKVETLICSMPSTRELVGVARFLDQTWNQARNAEFRVASRITGVEMDAYYDRWKAALSELVAIGCELARRAGLVEQLQRHKRVLGHYGYGPTGLKAAPEKSSEAVRAPEKGKASPAIAAA